MDLLNQFKEYLFSQDNKPSRVTVKNYLSDINHFIRWWQLNFNQTFSPELITKKTIELYKQQCLGTAHEGLITNKENSQSVISAKSLERHLSSLRKFFSFLTLEGKISRSPFDLDAKRYLSDADPFRLKDFKNYLYVYNASHLTIKNYLIDIKQFLNWAQEVLGSSNVLSEIDSDLVEEYKQRLLNKGGFSPSTINRKLSSLRKYVVWAEAEGLTSRETEIYSLTSSIPDQLDNEAIQKFMTNEPKRQSAIKNRQSYSKIPPFRLFQKISNLSFLALDSVFILPLANLIGTLEYALWKNKGQQVFKRLKNYELRIINPNLRSYFLNPKSFGVKNLKKELYAPLEISTKYFPAYKKAWFALRYKRPKWYKTYHSYPIVHYFHFAVLIIFVSAIGFGFYNVLFTQGGKSPTLAQSPNLPTGPNRILSFQGRLTDQNDNPITAPTNLRFAIYTQGGTATGSGILLWQEVDQVTPDVDGIFNALLGNTNTTCSNPTTPATGACAIPSSVFFQNNALFLGVTVESTPELTPRQQLATVAFATNSETLQGLLPITATAAGTTNVVLALDSSGNLTIGGSANPTFQASGGQFTLTGQPLLLTTNAGTNANITLSPDGLGKIALDKPLTNTSISNNIPSAAGSVEVDDLFSILASSSGQSALTINQTGAGPLISASSSGTAKFTVDNAGNVTAAGNGVFTGNVTASTIYTGGGVTYYINNATSNLNSLTLANNLTVSGNVSSNLIPSSTYNLGSSSNFWGNLYVNNVIPGTGNGTQGYWQRNNGALSPTNITDDLLIGGISTQSAYFRVTGQSAFAGTTSVASISAKTSFAALVVDNQGSGDLITASSSAYGTNPGRTQFTVTNTGTINARAFYDLDNTAYFLDPAATGLSLNTAGSASIGAGLTFNALGTSPSIQSTAYQTLTIGGNTTGDIVFKAFNGQSAGGIQFAGYNTCTLTTDSSGNLTCGTGSSGNSPFAQITGGVIVPNNSTVDFLVGGQSTTSATFGILNNALSRGNQIATLSGSLTLDSSTASIQTTKNQLLTIGGNSTGDIQFKPGNSSSSLYLSSTGNVGIGTTNPLGQLQVVGSGQTSNTPTTSSGLGGALILQDSGALSGNGGFLVFGASQGYFAGIKSLITNGNSNTVGDLTFDTRNSVTDTTLSERMRITAAGNVGIGTAGTTGPVTKLDVRGGVAMGAGTPTTYAGNSHTVEITGSGSNTPLAIIGGSGTVEIWKDTTPTQAVMFGAAAPGTAADGNFHFSTYNGSVWTDRMIILNSSGNIGINTSSPNSTLQINGAYGSNAALIVNQLNSGDIFTASASGTTKFTIGNNGNLTATGTLTGLTGLTSSGTITFSSFNADNNVLYATSGTGQVAGANTSLANLCLVSGVSAPTWTTCTGIPTTDLYWNQQNGALFPNDSTVDLLIGGQSSASAKFAVLNDNSGTPIASISSGLNGTSAYLTADGTLATQNRMNLTIGNSSTYNTTGNVLINPNGTGNVGIGVQSPVAILDLQGGYGSNAALIVNQLNSGDLFVASASGVTKFRIDNSGDLILTSNTATTTFGGITYSWPATQSSGYVLSTNGSGILSWIAQTGGGTNWWGQSLGSLFPINSTLDLLIGGQSTTSATFGILNNSLSRGNQIATLSGSLTLDSSTANIQTTKNQLLTIGGNSTGDIQFKPGNSSSSLYLSSTGNVGIGTTSPGNLLSIIGGNLSLSNAQFIGFTGNTAVTSSNYALFGNSTQTAINVPTGGEIDLRVNNSNSFTLTSSNVVISPSTQLSSAVGIGTAPVAGQYLTVASSTYGVYINGGTTAALAVASGNVGIGITSPIAPLHISAGYGSNAALIVNQLNSGDLFVASASGATKFEVTNAGFLLPGTTNTQDIGSTSLQWRNVYASNVLGAATNGIQGYWQRNLGTIAPSNITDDLLLGSTATATAQFSVSGIAKNQAVASVSGQLVVMPNNGWGGFISSANFSTPGTSVLIGSGVTANFANQAGYNDIYVGYQAGHNDPGNLNGYNIYIGSQAGFTDPGNNFGDLFIGYQAGYSTNGNYPNTFVGYQSGKANNCSGNTYLGYQTGVNSTGCSNVLIGEQVGDSLTTASDNTFVGNSAGNITSKGEYNAFFGFNAGHNNTVGGLNTFIGAQTDVNLGNLINATAIGANAYVTANNSLVLGSINGVNSATASANIGIGVTSPNNILQVTGGYGSNALVAINQLNSGDLFVASASGVTKFEVTNAGFLLPGTTNTQDIGSSSLEWRNIYGQNIYSNGTAITQYWQRNLGSLSPLNITDDLLVGGTSTTTAQFSISGIAKNQAVASVSGNLIVYPNNGWGGQVGIGVTNPNNLIQVANLINFDNTNFGTYLGYQTGINNSGVNHNTFIGYQAGTSDTTGYANNALGYHALYTNDIGYNNIAIGIQALYTNTGNNNAAMGTNTLYSNTTGYDNTALGYQALYTNNTGYLNTAVGVNALYSNTGLDNAAVGVNALYSNTTGDSNTALGYQAGYTSVSGNANTTGNNNTFVGREAGPGTSTQLNYATAIGAAATVNCSNCLVLGSINGINNATANTNVGIGVQSPVAILDLQGGYGSNAALIVNQLNSGDLFVASASGVTKFRIDNSGDLILTSNTATTTFGGIAYTWPNGTAGSNGQVLTTNGSGTLSWTSAGANYWQRNLGALSPANITDDLLLGGIATSTAKFAFLNMAGGTPTASVSGNLSLAVPTGTNPQALLNILNGGSLNFQTSVGGDSGLTSRLYIANNGNIGIGTTNPQAKLDIAGTSSTITNSSGNLTISPASNLIINNAGGTSVGINTSSLLATLDLRANNINGGTIPVASISGATSFASLVVDNQGSGDLITASSSAYGTNPARTQFTVTNTGTIYARSFYDLDNTTYYLDPAATGTSLNVAGGITSGTILPLADNTYSLGSSPSARWESLFLGPGSLHIQCKTTDSGCPSSQGIDYSLAIDSNGTLGVGANLNSSLTPALNITQGGWVGINTSTPQYPFDINENMRISGTHTITFNTNGSIGYNSSGSTIDISSFSGGAVRLQISPNNGYFVCKSATGTGLMSIGKCNGSAAQTDITENMISSTVEAGDIVKADPNSPDQSSLTLRQRALYGVKTTKAYDAKVLGIISEWGIRFDLPNRNFGPNDKPLSTAGVVPVKISTINGPIHKGDPITSSDIPGVGMLATKAGPIVAKALEDFDGSSATQSAQLINGNWTTVNSPCQTGQANCYNEGKILSLLDVSWSDPQVYLTSTGNLNLVDNTIATDSTFTVPHYFGLNDALGNPILRVGEFSDALIANLKAGGISARQVITNALNVTSENITINGQNIRDYITGIVQSILNNTNASYTSPIASVDELHTNFVSPVDNSSQIALDLGNSKLTIRNGQTASSSAVAVIDNLGNATFSGSLNSQSLTVGSNATIAGTLRAGKIIANQIEGLNIQASTVSAQYITNNVTNIYNSTPSSSFPTLSAVPTDTFANATSSGLFGNLFAQNNFINIASFSSQLAYVENLGTANLGVSQNLTVYGPTSLSDTSIVGQLSINGSLILSDNSINVLGSDLNLQPLRQGGLSIMAGLIYIDTNGNVKIGGDTTVNGTLYTNLISPIPGNDLDIRIGNNASGSAAANSQFNIQNSSGSAVLQVNQLGDLIASGTATFGKLNLDIAQPALALSSTEIVATGSAGTSQIEAHQTEITIDDPLVTSKSLIYVTPTSNTNNQVLFLLRQIPGVSFTVGVQNPSTNDIPFNWIIVN